MLKDHSLLHSCFLLSLLSSPLWSLMPPICVKWGWSTVMLNIQLRILLSFSRSKTCRSLSERYWAPWSLGINVNKTCSTYSWAKQPSLSQWPGSGVLQEPKRQVVCFLCSVDTELAYGKHRPNRVHNLWVLWGADRNTTLGSCLEYHPYPDLSGHLQQGKNKVWFQSLLVGKLWPLVCFWNITMITKPSV